MNTISLGKESDKFFEEAWSLYEESFSPVLKRLKEAQLKVMQHPLYHCDVIIEDQNLVGFLFWWDFDSCSYIEYFAISSSQRNSGVGKKVLENFIESCEKPIILEVELPHGDIDKRRIGFYQRIGFKLNDFKYVLPPMKEGDEDLELLLMTYPHEFPKVEVEAFIDQCHPIIMGAY